VLPEKRIRDFDIEIGDLLRINDGRLLVRARFAEIDAIERAAYGDFALSAATHGTDLTADAGAITPRPPDITDFAGHNRRKEIGSPHHHLMRSDLFIKVEIEHDEREQPEQLAEEICRRVRKIHGVREAELSNYVTHREEPA
jgi:hypothetical protein